MANILEVAMAEFAEKGLAGARIDEIAAATHTSKRMIYYYFGSKEGLYLAVLEQAYARMRAIESQLDLDNQDPESALRRLVEFTFDHHASNENYIRLVVGENIYRSDQVPDLELHEADPALHEERVAALTKLRAGRDGAAVDAALGRVRSVAAAGHNLMPALIDAVSTYATIGEISAVLDEVLGTWQQPGIL